MSRPASTPDHVLTLGVSLPAGRTPSNAGTESGVLTAGARRAAPHPGRPDRGGDEPPAAAAGQQYAGAVRTMDQQLSNSLTRRRFSVTLPTAFGVVSVALAAIGLYGVLAFIVALRREIGVRMALGAQPRDVIAEVMGQGMKLAGLGVVIGSGLALAGTQLLSSLLFGTSATDALTFAAVGTLLLAIAAAASLVPSLRASRGDPLIALRDE